MNFAQNIRQVKNKIIMGSFLIMLPFSACFAATAVEYGLQYFAIAGAFADRNVCLIGLPKPGSGDTGITIRNKAILQGTCGGFSLTNIDVKQQAVVNGPQLTAVGAINIGKNASVSPAPYAYSPPVALPTPAELSLDTSACDHSKLVVSSDTILEPGVYCEGLSIKDANVEFKPGTYTIKNGDLKVRGNANISGSAPLNEGDNAGVVVIFSKGAVDEKIGNVSIVTDGQVNFNELLIFQAAPDSGKKSNNEENEIKGAQVNLTAFIVTPDRKFSIEGSTVVNSSLCLVLLANSIEIGGRTTFTSGCNLTPPGT